ncbi:hypothetical protein BRADI_1g09816v3 [Brachypodium distachyon]|uniref:Uncharacterized protein n=1 Tax=Brachypodium distachyon TaxID=15368 RepID=A0A0Q3J670_BRADI|nr:hypothetical protein BRADI_1g09816v3 [Brachypodium distachyon]
MASIVFLDSPVGSGFSYARDPKGYDVGDYSSSLQVQRFLNKWFTDQPQYLSNPFYLEGDSYAGLVIPLIAHIISEVTKLTFVINCAMLQELRKDRSLLLISRQGYVVGNPMTDMKFDGNFRIPSAHGFGIISDQIYEAARKHCKGDYVNPANQMCAEVLHTVNSYLAYFWMNNNLTRNALGVKEGTTSEWIRCVKGLPYTFDLPSSIPYHLKLTRRGYRALVYSGDHDMIVPMLGTQAWIRSLNFSVVDDWRAWHLDGQAAGFTIAYANNLTFATIKGGDHTASEYRAEECFAMARRWLDIEPL